MSTEYQLTRQQHLPFNCDEAFSFFEDATNLEKITPDWLHFKITSELPIQMQRGTLIDYKLKLFCFPITWRTEILEYELGIQFVDQQIRGPYRKWHHLHTFQATADGTLMTDLVTYQLPLYILGNLAHTLWVKRTLNQIFDYRAKVIQQLVDEGTFLVRI